MRTIRYRWIGLILATIAILLMGGALQATETDQASPQEVAESNAVPSEISYQGVYTQNGVPVTGSRDMIFRFFNNPACSAIPLQSISLDSVDLQNGIFHVVLDVNTSLFNGNARWLRVQIDGDSIGCERILPTPYALHSASTEALHARPVSSAAPADGQLLSWNGSEWAFPPNILIYQNSIGVDAFHPITGLRGQSNLPGGRGVAGHTSAAIGTGYAIYGSTLSSASYAGYFDGRVHVTGDLSASGTKPFKIDHPLDPANQFLYHFALESPEIRNVYEGVVTLDANGVAVVQLPAYFAAVNTDGYRYQLTPMGAAMPNLHVAREIQDNGFVIAGGEPGMRVSWQITAVRNDPYLRDHRPQAETPKSEEEIGRYLYPQGYGQPDSLRMGYELTEILEQSHE
jgi:hypothetical protein